MRYSRLLFATIVLVVSTVAAHADTFSYDFSYTLFGDSFTYTSPTLITTDTSFTPTTCIFRLTGSCSEVDIQPTEESVKIFGASGTADTIASLPPSFFTVGTHTIGAALALTITDIPDPTSPVPEPSSIALLGTGILGLAGVARRKLS